MSETSVILPCYNVAKFLPDCLQSLEEQTFKDFEMIFVDDGSTDNTPQVLDDFCAKHENAKVIHKKNGGVSSARNEGLKNAKGEFIYFMDPDDFIDPRTLEIAYNTLKNSDADACIFNCKIIKENLRYKDVPRLTELDIKNNKLRMYVGREKFLGDFFSWNLHSGVWEYLYRNETLRQMPDYPNVFDVTVKYAEDAKFLFYFYLQINKIIHLPLRLYSYRQRKGSIMHSKFNEDKTLVVDFLEDAVKIVEKNYPKAAIYARSFIADKAQFCLCRMAKDGVCSEERAKKLYKIYKSGIWSCLFGVKNPYFTKLRFTELPYILHCKNKIVRRARKAAKGNT